MRANMRTTWLLITLSFQFHGVHLDTVVTEPTSKPPIPATIGGAATQATTPAAPVTMQTATVPTTAVPAGAVPTAAVPAGAVPTVAVPAAAVPAGAVPAGAVPAATVPAGAVPAATVPAGVVPATSKLTDKPAATQPQATAVTNNPSALSTSTSAVVVTTTPAAPSPATLKTTILTAPSGGRSNTVVSSSAPGLSGNTNLGTTKITKFSSVSPITVKQTITTITPRQDSKVPGNNNEKTAVTPRTTSSARGSAGNTAKTTIASTMTKAELPVAGSFSIKAQTMSPQTTTATTTAAQTQVFQYSLNNGQEKEEEKGLGEVCRRLMANLQDGNCTLKYYHHNGKLKFDFVEINGKVKTNLATQYYEEIIMKPPDNKILIAILASCGALLIMIVILAVCASHRRKPFNENQQHLTEELHTVENGYHDNPTLEVMEVQPEMQEKKMALNGEFNDSWIVPLDCLLKEEIPDEEDTHL